MPAPGKQANKRPVAQRAARPAHRTRKAGPADDTRQAASSALGLPRPAARHASAKMSLGPRPDRRHPAGAGRLARWARLAAADLPARRPSCSQALVLADLPACRPSCLQTLLRQCPPPPGRPARSWPTGPGARAVWRVVECLRLNTTQTLHYSAAAARGFDDLSGLRHSLRPHDGPSTPRDNHSYSSTARPAGTTRDVDTWRYSASPRRLARSLRLAVRPSASSFGWHGGMLSAPACGAW